MLPRFLSLAVLILAIQSALDACTTFCVRAGDRVIFGRNYDFEIGDGQLMVNAVGTQENWDYLRVAGNICHSSPCRLRAKR
jgi:hypothetical protein